MRRVFISWETGVGKSGAAYRFASQVCDGAGTVTVGDAGSSSSPASPAPVAPPAVCGRCGGTGTTTWRVATALDVYPVTRTCRACGGSGVIDPATATIAA